MKLLGTLPEERAARNTFLLSVGLRRIEESCDDGGQEDKEPRRGAEEKGEGGDEAAPDHTGDRGVLRRRHQRRWSEGPPRTSISASTPAPRAYASPETAGTTGT